MKGAVMRTERVRLRTGLRVSPAKMAMYSKPLSAPNIILVKTLRLNMVIGGITRRRGWYSESVPRQRLSGGGGVSTPRTMRVAIAPTLSSHFPIFSPRGASDPNPAIGTEGNGEKHHLVARIYAGV